MARRCLIIAHPSLALARDALSLFLLRLPPLPALLLLLLTLLALSEILPLLAGLLLTALHFLLLSLLAGLLLTALHFLLLCPLLVFLALPDDLLGTWLVGLSGKRAGSLSGLHFQGRPGPLFASLGGRATTGRGHRLPILEGGLPVGKRLRCRG